MTDAAAPSAEDRRAPRLLWALAALVAGACLLPYAGVILAAAAGDLGTLRGLAGTVLPGYAGATLALVALVGAGTFAIGATTAWLVTATDFPGRRLLEPALVIPLAFPGYVLAYAYTHLLDHPGAVQALLRDLTGWGPRDYWFPEIRSLGGAALMLTLTLFPYVYLLARAAFLLQGRGPYDVARSLGRGPVRAFLQAALPMARPAVAAGVLLVAMEVIADFGTVAFFGVQTFATGIYTAWFTLFDRAAAAQLALGLLAFALVLAVLERTSRGAARYAGRGRPEAGRMRLSGLSAAAATAACAAPVLLGAAVPALVLATMAAGSEQDLLSRRYVAFATNTVKLAAVAALVTVGAAVLLGTLRRVAPSRASNAALTVARLGYAVPGGVIAVGLLVPFAAFDNAVDAVMEARFGIDTGLLVTGSIWLLVGAYMVRFLAAAIGAYEGGLATVTANVDAAARVLGQGVWGTVRRVHLPVLRPALVTAGLIVFVDVVKELPATLILRPFDFDTLAVQAYRLAADERLEGAAVPSLVIAAVGLVPVLLLMRRMRTSG
ncbi:iron ABC transporter permease [Jannaschia sp. Os4]|uniref:ABC transporter permease n=1 Tax=Jannaschia sp. Os4 TaxID=2807617 RepID=UPI001939F561|nr:iron ABC transporter permease [Jannaschia sp. Os4]MBM2575321.1 iron ABC transporter permease [Jannaschia sp. Os4]